METITKENKKKKTPKKVAAKRPRDHDEPAVIQVFEAQVHYFNFTFVWLHLIGKAGIK